MDYRSTTGGLCRISYTWQRKYYAHINIEVCSTIQAVKYLFKYIYKGHDRTTAVVEGPVNEIKQYVSARYVSAAESIWRQFEFKIHAGSPAVTRLQVHLPGQQAVTFATNEDVPNVLARADERKKNLVQLFAMNRTWEIARDTLYADFPSKFTWDKRRKEWKIWRRGNSVGRMYFFSPSAGERYFLLLLLTVGKGATSFEELRTVDGHPYDTFKAECVARGLFETYEERYRCLRGAAVMQTGSQLRSLFVTILVQGQPAAPVCLWESYQEHLSDECAHQLRRMGVQNPSDEQITSLALNRIQQELSAVGKTLADYGLPQSAIAMEYLEVNNRLLRDQLDNDIPLLREQLGEILPTLNEEQRAAFDVITAASQSGEGGLFFIDGPGGTGKTFL